MNSIEQNNQVVTALAEEKIIQGSVASYRSLTTARNAAYVTAVTHRRIVMGDEQWYWVVSPADAERLVRAGYEVLP